MNPEVKPIEVFCPVCHAIKGTECHVVDGDEFLWIGEHHEARYIKALDEMENV